MEERYRNLRSRYGMNISTELNNALMNTLADATTMSGYSNAALLNLHMLTKDLPFLPQINGLTLNEFSDYFEKVKHEFIPETLSFTGRVPICTLLLDKRTLIGEFKINDFSVELIFTLTRQRRDTFVLRIYNGDSIWKTTTVELSGLVEFEVYMFNHFVVSDDAKLELESKLSVQKRELFVEEFKYTCTSLFGIMIRHVNIKVSAYEELKPTLLYGELLEQTHISNSIPNVSGYAISNVLDGLSVAVNIVIGNTVMKTSNMIKMNDIVLSYLNKKMISYTLDCVRIQASAFKRESTTIMNKANEMVDDSLDKVVYQTITDLNILSDKMSHVSAWFHTNVSSKMTTSIAIKRFIPAYFIQGAEINVRQPTTYYNGILRIDSDINFLDVERYVIKTITNLPVPGEDLRTTLTLKTKEEFSMIIEDTAQRVTYLIYTIEDTYAPYNSTMQRKRTRDYGHNNMVDLHFEGNDSRWFSDGHIKIHVTGSKEDIFKIPSAPSNRKVTFKSIIICDKHATEHLTDNEGNLAGSMYILGKKLEFNLMTASPMHYVSREFGELFALCYEFEQDSSLSYEISSCILSVYSGVSVICNPHDVNLRWGVFQYTLDAYNDVIVFSSDGLLDKCAIKALRNSDTGGTITITQFLRPEYFNNHVYLSNIRDKIQKSEEKYFYDDLSITDPLKLHDAFFNTIYIRLQENVKYKRKVSASLSKRRLYYNELMTDSDRAMTRVIDEINTLRLSISNIEQSIEKIQIEIDKILTTLHPAMANAIASSVFEGVLGAAGGVIIGKVVKSFSSIIFKHIGKLKDLTNALLTVNSGILNELRKFKAVNISLNVIGAKRLKLEIVSRSVNKSDALNLYFSTVQKAINKGVKTGSVDYALLCRTQILEDVSKLMLLEDYSRGVKSKLLSVRKSSFRHINREFTPEINTENNSVYLPSVSVYYRPLDVGIRSINKLIYKALVDKQKVQHDLLYNAMDMSVRRPGHSYAVFTNYKFDQSGEVIKTKIFTGIGELNVRGIIGSDVNSGIGGVCVKYKSYGNMLDLNGHRIFKIAPHSESGYDAEGVVNLYNTLFKTKLKMNPAMTENEISIMWEKIATQVDKKIVKGDLVHDSYIPDDAKFNVIKALVDDPPAFDYHLLNNNCQTYTKDLVNYIQTGQTPKTWSEAAIEKANVIMAERYLDEINIAVDSMSDDASALITRMRRAVDHTKEISSDFCYNSELNMFHGLNYSICDTHDDASVNDFTTAIANDYELVHFLDNQLLYQSCFVTYQ